MKLDELARRAVGDVLDASAVQAIGGLADLRRRRRHQAMVRGACAVAVIALIAGGLVLADATRGSQVQPAVPQQGVTNGALLGIPVDRDVGVAVLAGALPGGPSLDQVVPPSVLMGVGFSPDGTELTYSEPEPSRVVAVELGTGRRRTVWTCADGPTCSGWAALSPDALRVAHLRGYGNPRLEVTDLATGDKLVRPGDWAGPPVWSPEGSRLALATPQGIDIVEAGQSLSVRRLVTVDMRGFFSASTWSPDGARLAYVEPHPVAGSRAKTGFRLVVADVATGNTRPIRDLGACVCRSLFPPLVAWSPDGELIATTTITSRSWTFTGDVLLMRPDGTDVQPVGTNHNFSSLAWQPVPRDD